MSNQKAAKRHFELSPTFFNQSLLNVDPFELRDELFGSVRLKSDRWQLIETLLGWIEREAKKVCPDVDPYIIDGRSEDLFWNQYGNMKLNPREANAIAALRSIAVIRRLYRLDPWEHEYDSPTVATIALEVMTLITAAIRGDFLGEYMPLIERGAKQEFVVRSNLPKAAAAKTQNKELRRKVCLELAKPRLGKKRRQVVSGIMLDLQSYRRKQKPIPAEIRDELVKSGMLEKIPSFNTINDYVGDLFRKRSR